MASNRLHYLDFLRGLAAMLVVLQHATDQLHSARFLLFSETWVSIGQLGVLIFFLISGYIIPYSYVGAGKRLRAFWVSRVFRIYPLYFCVIPCTMFVDMNLHHIVVPHLKLALMAHLFFLQDWVGLYNFGGPSWTLFLELVWYLGFSAMCLLACDNNPRRVLMIVVPVYAVILLAGLVVHKHLPFGRAAYGLSFLIGYFCYQYRNVNTIKFSELAGYVSIVLLLVLASLYIGFKLHPETRTDVFFSFRCVLINWGLGLAIFGALFWHHHFQYGRLFLYVGKISYSTYMLHGLVLSLMSFFMIDRWAFVPIAVACTLVLSHFTYNLIEKRAIGYGKTINRSLAARRDGLAAVRG